MSPSPSLFSRVVIGKGVLVTVGGGGVSQLLLESGNGMGHGSWSKINSAFYIDATVLSFIIPTINIAANHI